EVLVGLNQATADYLLGLGTASDEQRHKQRHEQPARRQSRKSTSDPHPLNFRAAFWSVKMPVPARGHRRNFRMIDVVAAVGRLNRTLALASILVGVIAAIVPAASFAADA